MKIDILTLFPSMFDGFLNESIIKRAGEKGKVNINVHNIRDYSPFKNSQVDDYSYGGGPGLVLMCEPVFNAIEDLCFHSHSTSPLEFVLIFLLSIYFFSIQ